MINAMKKQLKFDLKCACGAHWKGKGMPQEIIDKVLLAWEEKHYTHNLQNRKGENLEGNNK